MAAVTELGYLTLGVSDLAAWKAFATHILGLEVVEGDQADRCYLRMDYWHHRITLIEDGSDDIAVTGLRVAGADEFSEILAQLRASGVEVTVHSEAEAEARYVLEVMSLKDPNGHALEIFHGPLVQFDKPFHSGRRMHAGFRTGALGMGHVMQSTRSNFAANYQFYRLLGMRGGIEYKLAIPGAPGPVPLMFMHCNERQHSLAFSGPAEKRANHILFEVEAMADVGLAYELVKTAGLPIIIEPGSHANDQMYSFYFKNPSGFMCEIGWGARSAVHQSEYYQRDSFGHAPVPGSMKGFMVPA
jgi:2,3-dihydroxyethylbenzene 1,2-dioxygenase